MTSLKTTLTDIYTYLETYDTDYDNNIFQLSTIIPTCLLLTVLKTSCTNNNISLENTGGFLVNMFNIFVYISILTFNLKKLPLLQASKTTKDNLYLLTSLFNVGTINISNSLQYILSFINNNNISCNSSIYNLITSIILGVTNYLIYNLNNITETVNQYDYTTPLDPTIPADLVKITELKTYSFYSSFSNITNIISIYILILNFVSNTSSSISNITTSQRKNIYSVLEQPEN